VSFRSAEDAFREGIATVYQELSLVPGLSVAENILLGRLPRRRGGWIDWPAARRQAGEVLGRLQLDLDVRRAVGELGVATQQRVEIAKAMSFDPAVLMLDEPTSALARHETDTLFRLLRGLAAQGVAIVYISHRLQELPQITDRLLVLRDGRLAGELETASARPDDVVRLMFGQVVQRQRPADLRHGDRVVLSVRGLSSGSRFRGVDLDLREGEILGLAGMLGSGRTELLRALFGADPCDGGGIALDGRPAGAASPALRKAAGMAFTPEERKTQALVQPLSCRANLCMAAQDRIARRGIVTRRRESAVVRHYVERLGIRLSDPEIPVSSLSGGNQQKVVVGKWLHTRPRVILFDEPTRGIDVEAKQQIFQILWDLSRQGIASLLVSSELEELLEVCHRILIMKKGRLVGEVRPEEVTADELYVRCMED
jgi:ribose transport system ATP-binding protein